MSPSVKRILGPILLVILVLGVGIAIYFSAREQFSSRRVIVVRGLIGSEKEDFFQDPRVIKALRDGGLEVHVEKAGSREIATQYNLNEYDFAFPSGVPAAEKIRTDYQGSHSYDAFFTPMAIASWQSIAQLLEANGVAQDQGGYYTLDMERFMELVASGKRWVDLENNAAYPVNKSVLITSTDVRTSNSAAMYLSLASFVANGSRIVQSESEIDQIMPLLTPLFEGYREKSTKVILENYAVMGMGQSPLAIIYEAQYIAAAAEGIIRDEMVLMYPVPTIFSKHIIVSLSEGGERLGKLLRNDPELQNEPKLQAVATELQRLEIEYGFRNNNMTYFREFTGQHKLAMPDSIVSVIDPPTYTILESMIIQFESLD
ncbi:MAG: hypothetical protein JXA89_26500 [Anaerolineae bacterium]|nr:hypothetical protein [Anaerolineae bacterium]